MPPIKDQFILLGYFRNIFFSHIFYLHNDIEERLEGAMLIKTHRIMNTSSSRHEYNKLEFNKIRIPGT